MNRALRYTLSTGLPILFVTWLMTGPASMAQAGGSFTVDSTLDAVDANPDDGLCATASSECTLRAAIQQTNVNTGDDTIILPAGTYILTILGSDFEDEAATGDLDITDDLVINGAGVGMTIIDGNGEVTGGRVLEIFSNTVSIKGLTITGGETFVSGSGIYSGGTVTIRNARISENGGDDPAIVAYGGALTIINSAISRNQGGGISVGGAMLTVLRSTIAGNSSSLGGGISSSGDTIRVDIRNSTISGNTGGGGGIYHFSGQMSIRNTTIYNNTGSTVGGIYYFKPIDISNTILAGNTGSTPDCSGLSGGLKSQGYNLLGNGTGCLFVPAAGDQVGTEQNPIDPLLGPLADNGGRTLTHALLAGSPAIDAGNPAPPGGGGAACEATDQRGYLRPVDGDGNGSAICDIGAYELGAGPP